MRDKKYDVIVVIGRFQPVHNAHVEIIRRASALSQKVVIVIGSTDQPRTYKNPFTAEERKNMLRSSALRVSNPNCEISIECVQDNPYNNQEWAASVQELVKKHSDKNSRVGIMGHEKDETSFYLKMFPQWIFEEVELIEPLHATDIRDLYFKNDGNLRYLNSVVPSEVMEFLENFNQSDAYNQIIEERRFIREYKKQFEGLAYPPIFVTSDAIVIQSGHVLLIKRRSNPGKGLYAFPGGFVNAQTDISVQDAMIRELKEETGIKVPVPVLVGNIKGSRVFDAIGRSERGRTITHAFVIVLPDGPLPKVKGLDDSEKSFWMPIADVRCDQMFEDHYSIFKYALSVA